MNPVIWTAFTAPTPDIGSFRIILLRPSYDTTARREVDAVWRCTAKDDWGNGYFQYHANGDTFQASLGDVLWRKA